MNQTNKNAVRARASLRHASAGPALALALLAAALPAAADHHGGSHDAQGSAAARELADEFVNAEVRKIDVAAGKLTLKHEALRKFDMAGMTMAFRVTDPAMFDGLAVGDHVRFIPDKRNGAFVIVRIEKQN
jgi:Cu/Ag efflux protein CusF